MTNSVVSLVCFQMCWFATIISAARGWPAVGPLLVVGWLSLHVAASARKREQLILVLSAAVLGYLSDSGLVMFEMIGFPSQARLGGPAALWMVGLWMGLAATFTTCLRWLRGRPVLAAIFGAIGGPVAYFGGSRFGAIELTSTLPSLAIIGIQYALLTPAIAMLAQALKQDEPVQPRDAPIAPTTVEQPQ